MKIGVPPRRGPCFVLSSKFPLHSMTNSADPRPRQNAFHYYVPVNSKTAHPTPPPPGNPGHLTRVKLRTVGNLTRNEARPVGHLTFVSVVGIKRIPQFFDSACEPRSQVIALDDFTWVFLLLLFYIIISWNLFKVWSENKLNKKFVVAQKFCRTCFHSCFSMPGGWGI